jgi:hypothetical protein
MTDGTIRSQSASSFSTDSRVPNVPTCEKAQQWAADRLRLRRKKSRYARNPNLRRLTHDNHLRATASEGNIAGRHRRLFLANQAGTFKWPLTGEAGGLFARRRGLPLLTRRHPNVAAAVCHVVHGRR